MLGTASPSVAKSGDDEPRTARAMPLIVHMHGFARQSTSRLNGNSFILRAVSAIGSHRMNLRYDSLRTRLIWPFVLLGAVSAILSPASFTIFSALEEQAIERRWPSNLKASTIEGAQSGRNTADSFAVARRQGCLRPNCPVSQPMCERIVSLRR